MIKEVQLLKNYRNWDKNKLRMLSKLLGQSQTGLRRTIINYYLSKGIKSKQDLKHFLSAGLGIAISDNRICGNPRHCSPFDFLWEMFSGQTTEALLWANRSGGKSFIGGLLTWLRSTFFEKVGSKILGGSFDQSKKSYQAMEYFWDATGSQDDLLIDLPQITKTSWKNGSKVEILTASHNSVRGPHQQKLVLDEVEEMAFDIFEAALSQPQEQFGIKSSTLVMSTMHKSYGVMNYLLQNHRKMGLKLFNWCVLEVIENCKDYQCSTCPIRSLCKDKAIKKANGHYKISDLVKKMTQLSRQAFNTEWLCQKPTREGLIYKEFSEDNETTAGFNENLPVDIGVDFGGTNPFAVTVWQVIDGIDIQIDEIYMPQTRNSYVIDEAENRRWWKNIRRAYCDPARPDCISEWSDAIKKVNKKEGGAIGVKAEVLERINLVESKIKPMKGTTSLKVNTLRCKDTLREYDNYHWKEKKDEMKPVKDEPEKVFDHAMDSTGYYVWGKYKRAYHFSDTKKPKGKKPIVTASTFDSNNF